MPLTMPAPDAVLDPGLENDGPIRKKKWTRSECEQLATMLDMRKYELIEGELIEKMSKKHPHSCTLLVVVERLRVIFGYRFVAQEVAIDVTPEDNPTSHPEPDAVVLTRSFVELAPDPRRDEVRLVIEISDATRNLDLVQKRDLYARAGIPEYWVFDLVRRYLVVHRNPENGVYESVAAYEPHESVAPLAAPDSPIPVAELLGGA